ncbi:MAG TPA: DUF6011 domain-containing protein [Mycobacterium sp.]|jgi:hypothetical protein
MQAQIATLADNLAKLPAKDQSFAASLVAQFANKGSLSEKQMYWVGKLAARATGTEAIPANVIVGDIAPIVALVTSAKGKFPALLLATETGEKLRISVAGAQAKVPGSINVTGTVKQADGRNEWFGRITVNGVYQPGGKRLTTEKVAIITKTLVAFAADPVGVAAAYGLTTGQCCFCAKTLTHPDSKAVGYGPDCAANWGLPWGAKATKALACEVV